MLHTLDHLKMRLFVVAIISILLVGSKALNEISSTYNEVKYNEEYEPYKVVTVADYESADSGFIRARPNWGINLTALSVLALIKLIFLKIKGLSLGFILLLKLPIILFMLFGKVMVMLQAFKFLKLLLTPLMLLGLLPMILGPLLVLAPFMLPILLTLILPVLPSNTTTQAPIVMAGRRKRYIRNQFSKIRRILESEMCIERIACRLGKVKYPIYNTIVSWGLKQMANIYLDPKLLSYFKSYKKSVELPVDESCPEKYKCTNKYFNVI